MMKKGISFSVVPLIALVGVLGLSIWAGYQLSMGGSYRDTSIGVLEEDQAIQNLESVKNILLGGLEFSSTQAALDIARNGGTDKITYWYCSSQRAVPEPEEVEYAMSTVINSSLNAYVKTLMEPDSPLFEIKPRIPEYTCVGVFEPFESNCDIQSSEYCEEFATSATAGPNALIEIDEPVYVNDDADLEAHLKDIRFYWLYYRLYNDFKIKDHSQYITITLDCKLYVINDEGTGLIALEEYKKQKREGYEHCYDGGVPKDPLTPPPECADVPGLEAEINSKQTYFGALPGSVKPDIESGLSKICEHYEKDLFADDGHVECDWEILCLSETEAKCLSSECARRPDPDICDTSPVIQLQAPDQPTVHKKSEGSVRFKVTLTDSKYKISTGEVELNPGDERGVRELEWNINGEIQLTYTDCPVLILEPVGGTQQGGGTDAQSDTSY